MQVINGKVDGFVGKDKIYIGRATKTLKRSLLANPYAIGFDGDRDQVIKLYKRWLWHQINGKHNPNEVLKELLAIARLVKADNQVIFTCYCKPLACHGDVLVNCVNWIIQENLV
jgi:hypothetical protein